MLLRIKSGVNHAISDGVPCVSRDGYTVDYAQINCAYDSVSLLDVKYTTHPEKHVMITAIYTRNSAMNMLLLIHTCYCCNYSCHEIWDYYFPANEMSELTM